MGIGIFLLLVLVLSTFSQNLASNESSTPEIGMYVFAPGTILTEICRYFPPFPSSTFLVSNLN
jgi:hypothetical protein